MKHEQSPPLSGVRELVGISINEEKNPSTCSLWYGWQCREVMGGGPHIFSMGVVDINEQAILRFRRQVNGSE